MPADRFVLYDATFRTPAPAVLDAHNHPIPPPPASPVATAANEAAAIALGSAAPHAGQTALTWVEYELEADGVTRCNGKVRDDLPPHTPPVP